MKKFFFSALLLCLSTLGWASKALTIPTVITQPDGTKLTVCLYGDEHFHWTETIDGVVLYQEGTAFYVATLDTEGNIQSTGQLAHEKTVRSSHEQMLIGKQHRTSMLNRARQKALTDMRRREPVATNNTFFPHTGNPRVLVVLAEFADEKFSVADPRATFEQYLNSMENSQRELGNGESSNTGSVKKYFHDNSYGQFSPEFDIVGPITLPKNMSIYGAGRNDRMDLFIPDVCNAIRDSVDFTLYDANGDNILALLSVIYAGYSANITGNSSNCIWPKSGTQVHTLKDGISTNRYGVNGELNGYPNVFTSPPYKRVNGIGMFLHEFSHCMGLPDLYPTVSAAQIDNQALEYWSLMDGGENLRNGWAPTAYTAWERESMGWMEIEELENDTTITLLPIDTEGGKAFRIRNTNDVTNKEYFILENIQQKGWNARQYGHGLLVFHIDYDSVAFSVYPLGTNTVNNTPGSPRMTIVPADGLLGTSYNKGKVMPWGTGEGGTVTSSDYNNQHKGDPYPGNTNRTSLTKEDETVNYPVYTSDKMDWALIDIKEENGAVTFTFLRDKTTSRISDMLEKEGRRYNTDSWYTLDGRQLALPPTQKGVYLHGQRKVIIR